MKQAIGNRLAKLEHRAGVVGGRIIGLHWSGRVSPEDVSAYVKRATGAAIGPHDRLALLTLTVAGVPNGARSLTVDGRWIEAP